MKNLALAGLGLVIAIVVIFLFASKPKSNQDTLIPQQTALPSEGLKLIDRPSSPPKLEATQEGTRKYYNRPPAVLSREQIKGRKARIKTAKGEIFFQIFDDSPIASSNFIFLAQEGFYDGLTFHRREEGFVIQGGDPNGNGTGGPGYQFNDEPVSREYKRGIVAMANAGPNTNGSQFFIMLADAPQLSKNYTIFGNVTEGLGVLDKINPGDVMERVTIE